MNEVTDFAERTQPFSDDFGIGLTAVAEIRLDMAERDMGHAAMDAFSTGYVNPEWRAMKRRLFNRARAEYEAAKAVLS